MSFDRRMEDANICWMSSQIYTVAPLLKYKKEPWSTRGQNSDAETYVLYPLGVDFPQNRPSYKYLILNEWREYSLSTAVNGFHRVGYWKKRASIVWANPLGILYLLYLVYELIDILLNGARPWIFKREIRILVCL